MCEVVGECNVSRARRTIFVPAAVPRTICIAEFFKKEVAERHGGFEPTRVVERKGGFGDRGEHHCVPLGDDLVIESWPRALRASVKECATRRLDVARSIEATARMHAIRNRSSFEVAGVADAVPSTGILSGLATEAFEHLARRPGVVQPFVAVTVFVERVRIKSAEESSSGMTKFVEDEVDRFAGDLQPTWFVTGEASAEIHAREQCLVVEHLFEVGDEPLCIDAVAGKASAEVVIHPATGHCIQGHLDDPAQVVARLAEVTPQEEIEVHRAGELRRSTESSPSRVECCDECIR